MYVGGNKNNNYYSLTNNELNTINTSNNGIIYLGDYYVTNSYKISLINTVYINGLSLLSAFAKLLYIYSGNGEIFIAQSSSIFSSINLYLISLIKLSSLSSILLNSTSFNGNLFIQANENCTNFNNNLYLETINGGIITYHGGNLIINNNKSYINSFLSTIIISKRCAAYNSVLIGDSNNNNNNNYSMTILKNELINLYSKIFIFNHLMVYNIY